MMSQDGMGEGNMEHIHQALLKGHLTDQTRYGAALRQRVGAWECSHRKHCGKGS